MVNGHLFVLVHGLWGGAGHLKAIEDTLKITLKDSEEDIHFIRPKTSSLFKTYNGIEIIGQRMLLEVLQEIKSLSQDYGVVVTKISFVGYSLGGIVSRYMIGELEELGIFDYIEPCYFATFATPHMGTWFFKRRFGILNFLGSRILGLAGSELFIKDKKKILVQLTEGPYIEGLKKFHKRYLFANVRHDRTVSFYTAYITNKNPFDAHWKNLELSFDFKEEIIPSYVIRGISIKPKIVNLHETTFLPSGHSRQKPTWVKKLRYIGIAALVSMILPFWFPFIFTASTIGSIASYFIVRTFKRPQQIDDLKEKIINGNKHYCVEDTSDDEVEEILDLQERLDEYTGEAIENVMNLGEYDANTDMEKEQGVGRSQPVAEENMDDIERSLNNLHENIDNLFKNSIDVNTHEIFEKTDELKLDEDRQKILNNLNELEWYKFAVYINVLNAHDGLVARKGLKTSTIKGVANITFFGDMINRELKEMNSKRRKQ